MIRYYTNTASGNVEGSIVWLAQNCNDGDILRPSRELIAAAYPNMVTIEVGNNAPSFPAASKNVIVEDTRFAATTSYRACRDYQANITFRNCVFDGGDCTQNGACFLAYGHGTNYIQMVFENCLFIGSTDAVANTSNPGIWRQSGRVGFKMTNCLLYLPEESASTTAQMITGFGSAYTDQTMKSSFNTFYEPVKSTGFPEVEGTNIYALRDDADKFLDATNGDFHVVINSEFDTRIQNPDLTTDVYGIPRSRSLTQPGAVASLLEINDYMDIDKIYTTNATDIEHLNWQALSYAGVPLEERPDTFAASAVYVYGFGNHQIDSVDSEILADAIFVTGANTSFEMGSYMFQNSWLGKNCMLKYIGGSNREVENITISYNCSIDSTSANLNIKEFIVRYGQYENAINRISNDMEHMIYIPNRLLSSITSGSCIAPSDGLDLSQAKIQLVGFARDYVLTVDRGDNDTAKYYKVLVFARYGEGTIIDSNVGSGITLHTTPANDGGGHLYFDIIANASSAGRKTIDAKRSYICKSDTSASMSTASDWGIGYDKTDTCTDPPYTKGGMFIIE